MGAKRFSRNEALFGGEGQERVGKAHVAIVGLGGLGSHVAQQLGYLGVPKYGLVDPDVVTDSSLNRLVGAVDADVEAGTAKVDVAERTITGVQPDASVQGMRAEITNGEARQLVVAADVVFGCVDRDLARLQLTEMCARHGKPYFDLATDTGGEGDDLWYGGRVTFCDGNRCLICLDMLDQEAIAIDSMDDAGREEHERIYGVRGDALHGTGPMVVSVNGLVASIAVTEFMAHITGLRPPIPNLIYRGEQQVIRRSNDPPEPGCYFCTGLWRMAANPK